jgi:hypothetical protein
VWPISTWLKIFFFWDRVSLCSPGWCQTCNSPTSASLVLGLQPHTTMPSCEMASFPLPWAFWDRSAGHYYRAPRETQKGGSRWPCKVVEVELFLQSGGPLQLRSLLDTRQQLEGRSFKNWWHWCWVILLRGHDPALPRDYKWLSRVLSGFFPFHNELTAFGPQNCGTFESGQDRGAVLVKRVVCDRQGPGHVCRWMCTHCGAWTCQVTPANNSLFLKWWWG